MRLLRSLVIPLCSIFLSGSVLRAEDVFVEKGRNGIVITNGLLRRELTFGTGTTPVVVSSFAVRGRGELLAAGTGRNWFELPVGGLVLGNLDSCWQFEGHSSRRLKNGGTEVRLRFVGTAAAAALEWEALMQFFPGSTLCREKILFRVRPGASIRLGPSGGIPLLLFPGYRFRRDDMAPLDARVVSLSGWGRDLRPAQPGVSFDDRMLEEGTRVGKNLAQNYMYHPAESAGFASGPEALSTPGPLLFLTGLPGNSGIMFAYEHGAPDGDSEQEYLHIRRQRSAADVDVAMVYLRGIYAPGETLAGGGTVQSVWNAVGAFDPARDREGYSLLRRYLLDQITESTRSRDPFFYYNTWGMQRDEERKGADVRGILTRDRVIKEIALARKLNVDLFVLDDGWQERFGDWRPDARRFQSDLRWYVDSCRAHGLLPGLWIAPLATDPEAPMAREHSAWLIRDERGTPVIGRWEKNVFCFSSGYRATFIANCKKLIDVGIRYFKWDGIDRHLCSSPVHDHGGASRTEEERRAQQGYSLPLQIADAIGQLRAYNSDVVVEVDVTEPGRSVGLAILSEGKYFWMNNGASAYGDLSTYRSKSTRMVANLYQPIFPMSLQTYANYPHRHATYGSWRNNVNSSLIGGLGFWGDLSVIPETDLGRTGDLVGLAKRVLPSVAMLRPRVTGSVGASPEIYELVDCKRAIGQIIGFSGSALQTEVVLSGFARGRMLAVLRNAYSCSGDTLRVPFDFPMSESSREAFVIPNGDCGITVAASTSWLADAAVRQGDTLAITPGAPGIHIVEWDSRLGVPRAISEAPIDYQVQRGEGGAPFLIRVRSDRAGVEIRITGRK